MDSSNLLRNRRLPIQPLKAEYSLLQPLLDTDKKPLERRTISDQIEVLVRRFQWRGRVSTRALKALDKEQKEELGLQCHLYLLDEGNMTEICAITSFSLFPFLFSSAKRETQHSEYRRSGKV